jgi:hypothetical protein
MLTARKTKPTVSDDAIRSVDDLDCNKVRRRMYQSLVHTYLYIQGIVRFAIKETGTKESRS